VHHDAVSELKRLQLQRLARENNRWILNYGDLSSLMIQLLGLNNLIDAAVQVGSAFQDWWTAEVILRGDSCL